MKRFVLVTAIRIINASMNSKLSSDESAFMTQTRLPALQTKISVFQSCTGASPTCIVNSSKPDILFLSSPSTLSTTLSSLAYVVFTAECGPCGSYPAADGASWMWIDPIKLVASLGQNRGDEYDDKPSMDDNCGADTNDTNVSSQPNECEIVHKPLQGLSE